MSKRSSSTSSSNVSKILVVLAKLIITFVVFLGFFFICIAPQYSNGYDASLLDKMERAKSIEGPKILLIGNSNLSFGIDSELIEEATGMPVVNMGLHGALGNSFHDAMARETAGPDDIVIFVHTDYSETFDPVLAWTVVENHPSLWKLIAPEHYWDMLVAFPTYVKKALELYLNRSGNLAEDSAYARSSFNEYGDNTYSIEHDNQFAFEEDYETTPPTVDEGYMKKLNELASELESRGVTCFVAAYPIAYDGTSDLGAFDEYDVLLSEKTSVPVISKSRDYIFPLEDFYDATYHLRNYAVIERTNQLIADLQAHSGKAGN